MDRIFIGIAVAVLIVAGLIARVGWNNTLLDLHSFRQTQTAISAYYIANGESPVIPYQTPLFGKPWAIPFEFPTYQLLTAWLHTHSHLHLDQAGRTVSLAFFYLSLTATCFLLRMLELDWRASLLTSIFTLSNPLFLYWSRAFMIESTAVFFGVLFLISLLALSQSDIFSKKIVLFALTLVSGALCGLTKSTTFAVFLLGGCLLIAEVHRKDFLSSENKWSWLRSHLPGPLLSIVISLIISYIWVWYTDQVKSQNALAASFLTSSSLEKWNFGTWMQRVELVKFLFSAHRLVSLALGSICLAFAPRRRFLAFSLLGAFLSGPLVFTNLYVIHIYYWYANTIFLMMFVGITCSEALTTSSIGKRLWISTIAIGFVVFSFFEYGKDYYPYQKVAPNISALSRTLELYTKQTEVVLLYGMNWSAEVPYYANRRAIMDPWKLPLDDPQFQKAIRDTGPETIAALSFPLGQFDMDLLEKATFLQLTRAIYTDDNGYLVLLKSDKIRDLPQNSRTTPYSIDLIAEHRPNLAGEELKKSDASHVRILGWAVDAYSPRHTAVQVFIEVDGDKLFPAVYGFDRPDVSRYLHITTWNSGFNGLLDLSKLNDGPHRLALRIYSANRRTYYHSVSIPLTITE